MNTLILDMTSECEDFLKLTGGKATNLRRLSHYGLNVPKWFVVTTNVFDHFIEAANFDITSFNSMSDEEIVELFCKESFDENFKKELKIYLERFDLSESYVSVRSSGLEEDSKLASFAGQFSTFLFVKGEDEILKSIKMCFASAFSKRIMSYREQKKIKTESIKMGVVIQKMLFPKASGVLFTRNPIDINDRKNLLISSSFGVGEGVVSGLISCDEFKVDRENLTTNERKIEEKSTRLDFVENELKEVSNSDEAKNISSLSDEAVIKLSKLSLEIEKNIGSPQDIEFAVENDEIFLLQTRPITHLPNDKFFDKKTMGEHIILWDNSNIIESYSGVTSPLTFSFASYAYREVYIQFLEFMGVPEKEIQENHKIFRNLLGLIRGRIYYNLIHWYELVLMLPGSENNKSFLETMMGVKKSLDADTQKVFDEINLSDKKTSLKTKLFVTLITLKNFIFIDSVVKKFQDEFGKTYEGLRKRDFKKDSLTDLTELYSFLENDVLAKWKAPIINDYLCMIFFGLLKKFTEKWLPKEIVDTGIQNDLLCGQGDLESTEPTKMLMRLARKIDLEDQEMKAKFLDLDPESLLKDEKVKLLIEPFLDKFGFRCANELKLEENDLHDDPSFVIYTLSNYIRMKSYQVEEMEKRELEIRLGAEKKVSEFIKGPKKLIYFWILKQARKAVRNRENLRFLRTKIFGITRHLFRAIGFHFESLGIISRKEQIFYLKIEEIRAIMEGRSLGDNYLKLASSREDLFESYKNSPPPPDRFLTIGAAGIYNHEPQILEAHDLLKDFGLSDDPDLLIGTPCCPGLVEGEVRVAKEFKDAQGLNGEILVTERTDPGWVPLYPSCSALVIERGSLLSHSAVVARELGLPTIIGVNGGLMNRLKTKDKVRVDASSGQVRILERAP